MGRVTDRLRALLPKAIAVLDREMDQATASVSAILRVIRACALCAKLQPSDRELEVREREAAKSQFTNLPRTSFLVPNGIIAG